MHTGPKPPNLEVDVIAAQLEGLEETIIARLIDRAQFCANETVYRPGHSGFSGEDERSLFQVRLYSQERMDAEFGRFCVPEERPFFSMLPGSRRTVMIPDTGLHLDDIDKINLMPEIVERYIGMIPRLCRAGDDGHYGSSVEHDVYAVQAVARRIHFGALYVAESKFLDNPELFTRLAGERDEESIMTNLTRKEVEERIVQRTREKTIAAQAKINIAVRHRIDPEVVTEFYRIVIMPLTKKGEVLYLLNRCTGK